MKYKIFSFFIGLGFIGQLTAQDTSKVNNHNYTLAEKNIIDITQQIVPGRKNSPAQQMKPYIILISADGFRADFAEKYEAKNLQNLSNNGIRAKFMTPSYPSVTFPNHYSIVTGLYPSHHGLVDNSYIDVPTGAFYNMGNKKMVAEGKWYGGTPLWVLAEKQQMITASFYWVASEAAIQGIRPTYYYNYSEKIPIGTRIKAVKDWLMLPEENRPHFITFYFPDVDHDAHDFGPEDPLPVGVLEAMSPISIPVSIIDASSSPIIPIPKLEPKPNNALNLPLPLPPVLPPFLPVFPPLPLLPLLPPPPPVLPPPPEPSPTTSTYRACPDVDPSCFFFPFTVSLNL